MNSTRNPIRLAASSVALSVAVLAPKFASATVLYSNGFEPGDPGAADFYDSTTGVQPPPPGELNIVPSGGGVLGLPAASGSNYAEIHNVPDTYLPGYGESIATDYGFVRNGGTFDPVTFDPTGPGVASGGHALYESAAYYINTNWSAPGSPGNTNTGFWIDTTPHDDPGFQDESNFRIYDAGNGTIGVQLVGYGIGSFPSTTITQSGWYTFKTTFENDGGSLANTLSVADSLGNTVVSGFNDPANYGALHTPLAWSSFDGTNYGDWTTVWSDGFAGDVIGIDDVQVGEVPEPASLGLLSIGGLALLRRRRS